MTVKTYDVTYPEDCVREERIRQDTKWGVQNHDDFEWLAILVEEVGEIGKSLAESRINPESELKALELFENMKQEIVQTAAVCIAWLENIRSKEKEGNKEPQRSL